MPQGIRAERSSPPHSFSTLTGAGPQGPASLFHFSHAVALIAGLRRILAELAMRSTCIRTSPCVVDDANLRIVLNLTLYTAVDGMEVGGRGSGPGKLRAGAALALVLAATGGLP